MDFDEIMDTALTQLTELAVQRQREEDEDMDALVKRRIELSGHITALRESVDEPNRQIIDEYLDVIESIHSEQAEHLYLQGARDCILILKKLGVI